LDKQVGQLPVNILCEVLGKVCIPLAGERIEELKKGLTHADELETTMVEVELCVSLIFKPLRHHMKILINEDSSVFLAMWVPILNVVKEILESPSSKSPLSQKMTHDTCELTMEHLRNVIMVLSSFGVLKGESEEYAEGSISAQTWSSIEQIEHCKKFIKEWKSAASKPPSEK